MIAPTIQTVVVQRLELACARDPASFARVTRWAAVTAVLVFVLVFMGSLAISVYSLVRFVTGEDVDQFIVLQLLLGGYLVWTGLLALRSSTMGMPKHKLNRLEAPKLFHLLDKISREVGVALPSSVVLSGDMQAEILWSARLGVLGVHRHTLVLGLPLLMVLDVKQLASVVAHELARLGATQGRIDTWVYGICRTWAELAQQVPPTAPVPRLYFLMKQGVVGWFLRRVFPWFNARALVLARHQSFAADKLARRVAGSQAAMDALVRLAVQRSYLEHSFWPEVWGRASHAPTPNVLPFRAMAQRFRLAKPPRKAKIWLTMALKRRVQPLDAQPALSDRLARAKLTARLTKPPEHSAAKLLLGEALDTIVIEMDMAWQREVTVRWNALHREHLVQHRLEKELRSESEKGTLHADDQLLWARAARRVQGEAAYEDLLRLMLIDHADDANGRYELGCLLIEKIETDAMAQGAELLRALALEQTSSRSLAAAQRYGEWLQLQDKGEEVDFWMDEIRRLQHLTQEAHHAGADFKQLQRFTAPDLSMRLMRRVREALSGHNGIAKAHLVSKSVAAFPGWRFAVLLVESRAASRSVEAQISALLAPLELPALLVVVDASDPAWLTVPRKAVLSQIRATSGALVLEFADQSSSIGPLSSRYMPA